MGSAKLVVRETTPGSGIPGFVDVSAAGLDPDKDVELLINGTLRRAMTLSASGGLESTLTVSAGVVRDALVDIGECFASGDLAEARTRNRVICSVKIGTDDSIQLRYKA